MSWHGASRGIGDGGIVNIKQTIRQTHAACLRIYIHAPTQLIRQQHVVVTPKTRTHPSESRATMASSGTRTPYTRLCRPGSAWPSVCMCEVEV
jgi:hypothetical protein